MGKRQPSAPPQIDPQATARAQSTANRETAITQANLNMLNQYTPTGSLEFTQRGTAADGTPQYSATQTLTPNQQQILDLGEQASIRYGTAGNALLGNVQSTLSTPFDMSQFGAAPVYDDNFRNSQLQALRTRYQPEADRQRQALETQLANQGIGIGSQAYNAEMDRFQRGLNDFNIAADLNAGNLAAAEYGRMQQGRQNRISEALMPRQLAINETAALMSGNQLSAPSYVNTPQTQVAPTDTTAALGMNQQNALMQQQMAMQSRNAAMGGLFGLGGALGGGYMASGGRFF